MTAARAARVSFPLLFAALTGRSGHGLARMSRIDPPIRSASNPLELTIQGGLEVFGYLGG